MGSSVFLKTILLFVCIIGVYDGYTQSQYIIDSLTNILVTAKNDSTKIGALTEIAIVYGTRDTETSLKYCDKAWSIASQSKENPTKLKCYVRCIYAHIYRYAGDSVKCKQNIQAAEQVAKELNEDVMLGLVYNQLAMYYVFLPQYPDKKLKLLLQSADLLENSDYHRAQLINYQLIGNLFQRQEDLNVNVFYTKKMFKHITNANDRILTYYVHAGSYINKGSISVTYKPQLDSGILLLKLANRLLRIHKKRVKDLALLSSVSSMLGTLYASSNLDYIYNRDSAIFYLQETRTNAFACGDKATYAASCMVLSKFYVDEGNLKEAEYLLKEAKKSYYSGNFRSMPATEPDLYAALTFLYEKKGQYKLAIANYMRYIGISDTLSNTKKLNSIRNAEAKFLINKKEQQLKLQEERDAIRRHTIYFSLALSGLGMLLFVLIYRSHLFRKKFFETRKNALRQQAEHTRLKKEETELLLQIEIEESKKTTLQHSLEAKQKEQYQRELMTTILHLEKKNELLLKLKEAIVNTSPVHEKDQKNPVDKNILKLIDKNLEVDNDFERFSKNFELIYPNFFTQLIEHATENLSQLDLRYCAYMYMGLSTKEMSNLLNIDPASVRTARYRLKQKFNLGKEIELMEFLNNSLSAVK